MNKIEKRNERQKTKLIYKFLVGNGFDPSNYQKILEISGYPTASLTALLKGYSNIILLSYFSSPKSVETRKGDIVKGQIIYPEEQAELAMGLKLRAKDPNTYPKIDTFDAFISTQLTNRAFELIDTPQDKFFGFFLDERNQIRAELLLSELNKRSNYVSTDKKVITESGSKTLRLIRPKCLKK